ncbi:MAG: 50S ribosomal protein L5 [Puniceicoccales bacterium]|jgi:large subunit ribosomal protein L5|nr:50S ribosomal protein L5 [Puniceicoccales bacterium]
MDMPELQRYYKENVREELRAARCYGNVHEIPALQKVVINSAISSDADKFTIEELVKDVAQISCQKPVVVLARKSISNFKLRAGVPNGVKVTLRGRPMYHFVLKFIKIALPMIRDFQGISPRFDGNGNFTIGVRDYSIFPEISVDRDKKVVGMDVTFQTTARTDREAFDLLESLGMPFVKKKGAAVAPAV